MMQLVLEKDSLFNDQIFLVKFEKKNIMKNILSRKNIGWVLTIILSCILLFSAYGKLAQTDRIVEMLDSNNLLDWITILGIGELVSLIIFVIPKTMRFGTLLLSAYFGGAIVFHMAHPIPGPETEGFLVPVILLVLIWITSWVRGLDLFDTASSS